MGVTPEVAVLSNVVAKVICFFANEFSVLNGDLEVAHSTINVQNPYDAEQTLFGHLLFLGVGVGSSFSGLGLALPALPTLG